MSSAVPIQLKPSFNALDGRALNPNVVLPVQPHVQPFKQGILDSFCGVYMWINAVHYLLGELGQTYAVDLFNQMVAWLDRKGLLAEVAQEGMSDRLILRLHKWHIAKFKHPNPALAKSVGCLETRRLEFCVFESSVHLQSYLRDCPLLANRSALLLFTLLDREDGCEHITLAWQSNSDYLYVFDSSIWTVLPWSEIRVPTERSRQSLKKRYTVYPRYMRWVVVSGSV